MADGLTVEWDTKALFAALDSLGPLAEARLREAARVTAEAVRDEAQRRVGRQSGATAEGIVIREYQNSPYFLVTTSDVVSEQERARRRHVQRLNPRQNKLRWTRANYENVPHVGVYLEYGTVRATDHPFFWGAASAEASAFDRRIKTALSSALEETGLGR